jgi:dTDP-4-amino-4,6-dideoxygalactose transaminase
MWPRLRLDIDGSDLCAAAWACAAARERRAVARRIEERWSERGDALACLSVRSALDLFLAAAELPARSEVLVSALTIPDMARVLAAHGLVSVPVDLELASLAPRPEALEAARTPRTRAVLVAHLFGSRTDLGPVLDFAARHGLLVLEDCAQAYAGDGWRGHERSDVSFFSFGMIKTATALGGGIARVRDVRLLQRMRELEAIRPVAGRGWFARRVLKAALLHALSGPRTFAAFAWLCRARGREIDDVLHAWTRGFPGPDFLERIRRQPNAALLHLLERRLASYPARRVERRSALGEELARALPAELSAPGRAAPLRTHWVFPVQARDPARLVARLRSAGFDATRRSSLVAIAPPVQTAIRAPEACARLLREVVYVPLVPGLDPDARRRLMGALGREEESALARDSDAGVERGRGSRVGLGAERH